MQIYPEKYDKLDLNSIERSLLRTIERAFHSEVPGYYVLHINPRKITAGQGKPELFNLLITSAGIFLLSIIDTDNSFVAKLTIDQISNSLIYGSLCNDIRERLEKSKYLVNEENKLRFAFNVTFVFPGINFADLENDLSVEVKTFCRQHVLFHEDIQTLRKDGGGALISRLISGEKIKEDEVNCIFQRLCPEITIPNKYTLPETQHIQVNEAYVNELDRSVRSYRLDKWQIDVINRINRGNQLILACAGSGKSVLLISKCFKLASLNPSEDFLITCYNRNLNNYYQWAISQAGFIDRNVKCTTFYGLCRQLLENNGIGLPSVYAGQENEYFENLFQKANNALQAGKIKERFYGIFIDEVQIFKPEWYRFCFNLLKSKSETDHYFVIAGDKSQDIKNNIKRGKAPWQGGGADYPEYRGKTLPIERNYRNSKPINDAIDRYVECAKQVGADLGVDLTSDPELFLRGTAYREGTPPSVIELADYSNEGEGEAICNAIRKFLAKGYSEVDIAVILYNRHAKYTTKGWKTSYYNLLPAIKSTFYKEGWEYPAILISGESEGATYGSRRGVTITTIEGSLGLDFRAVILAGLRPLGIHEKAQKLQDFHEGTNEQQLAKLEAFKKNVNFLYTGCTRAKDELTIILSQRRGESVYVDLIRDSIGKG